MREARVFSGPRARYRYEADERCRPSRSLADARAGCIAVSRTTARFE